MPLNPPPPNQQNDGFPLDFLLKGPQTELQTLSQNCEQTLQKLRKKTELWTNGRFWLLLSHWNHYQINLLGLFSPVMFLSKITELIVGEFSSGNSLQDLFMEFWSECHGIAVNGKVFSVMGPNNYQVNSLGRFSGNDPVKNCRKQFTENFFRSVMLVLTMVGGWQTCNN